MIYSKKKKSLIISFVPRNTTPSPAGRELCCWTEYIMHWERCVILYLSHNTLQQNTTQHNTLLIFVHNIDWCGSSSTFHHRGCATRESGIRTTSTTSTATAIPANSSGLWQARRISVWRRRPIAWSRRCKYGRGRPTDPTAQRGCPRP